MRRPGISDEVFRPQNAHLRRVTGSLKKRFFCVIGSLERDTCKREREREREKAPEIVFFVVVFFLRRKTGKERKRTTKTTETTKKKEKQKLKRGRPIKSNQGGSLGDDFTREKKTRFLFLLFIYLLIYFFGRGFFLIFFPFSITNARR